MNLDLDPFTYITGVAGLLGLLIQFKDGFAEHREIRRTIVLLIVGIFVGSLLSAIKGIKIDLGASISPINALIAFTALVVGFVAVAATFTGDAERRGELFGFTALGGLLVLVLVAGAGIASSTGGRPSAEQLSLEELMNLADNADSRGNFERAIFMLERARQTMPLKDERREVLSRREKAIKEKQVAQPQ